MPLKIHTVRPGDALFDAVARLRYQVYALEEGLALPDMDHASQTVTDALDPHSVVLAALDGDNVVGTIRWTPLPAFGAHLPLHARLALPLCPFDLQRQIVIGRLMVLPSHRCGTACVQLLKATYRTALEAGVLVSHIESSPRNLPLYEPIGCRRVLEPYSDSTYGLCVPMVLLMHDGEHLDRVGSLLQPLLTSHLRGVPAPAPMATPALPFAPPASVRLWSANQQHALWAELTTTTPALTNGLSPADSRLLLRAATVLSLPAGQRWLARGNVGTELYLVLQGEVTLTWPGQGPGTAAHAAPAATAPTTVQLSAGQPLPATAVLTGQAQPLPCDATAGPDTRVLAFGAAAWAGLHRALPKLMPLLDERLRRMGALRNMAPDPSGIG